MDLMTLALAKKFTHKEVGKALKLHEKWYDFTLSDLYEYHPPIFVSENKLSNFTKIKIINFSFVLFNDEGPDYYLYDAIPSETISLETIGSNTYSFTTKAKLYGSEEIKSFTFNISFQYIPKEQATSVRLHGEGGTFVSFSGADVFSSGSFSVCDTTMSDALVNGEGNDSIESVAAQTPVLTIKSGDDPAQADFDFSFVTSSKMNPRDGAMGTGAVVFGKGNTAMGRNNFITGTRNFTNGNEASAFGQGNYNAALFSAVFGGSNLVLDGRHIFVSGSGNEVADANSNCLAVFGNRNILNNVQNSLVVGRSNHASNLYDGILMGRANSYIGTGDSVGNIVLGSYYNKTADGTVVYHNPIGMQNTVIGHYHRINGNISYSTLIGYQLEVNKNGKVIIGNNNDKNEDLTNYSVVIANGAPGGTSSNAIKIPVVGSTLPIKINYSIDISGKKLSVKDIEITGSIDRVSSPLISNTIFKADESLGKLSVFKQMDCGALNVGGKLTTSSQIVSSKYHGPANGIAAYSEKITIEDGVVTLFTDSHKSTNKTIITRDSVTSPKFIGNLEGTSDKAIKDEDGNKISETYVKKTDSFGGTQLYKHNLTIKVYKTNMGEVTDDPNLQHTYTSYVINRFATPCENMESIFNEIIAHNLQIYTYGEPSMKVPDGWIPHLFLAYDPNFKIVKYQLNYVLSYGDATNIVEGYNGEAGREYYVEVEKDIVEAL